MTVDRHQCLQVVCSTPPPHSPPHPPPHPLSLPLPHPLPLPPAPLPDPGRSSPMPSVGCTPPSLPASPSLPLPPTSPPPIPPPTCASPSPKSIVSSAFCRMFAFSCTKLVSSFLMVFMVERRLLRIWWCSVFNVSRPDTTVFVLLMIWSCDSAVILPISSIFFLWPTPPSSRPPDHHGPHCRCSPRLVTQSSHNTASRYL